MEAADLVRQFMAAARLARPLPVVPAWLAGLSLADASALQRLHVQARMAAGAGPVVGVKLGGTTQVALDALRLDAPFTGPVFSGALHDSGAVLERGRFIACILEAEIGIVLARPLDGPVTREVLLDAIAGVFPVIEIADSRWQDWARAPAAAIVADLGYAGALVRGASCTGWSSLDLRELSATLTLDGEVIRTGLGRNVLGDPLDALALAATQLQRLGQPLDAGTLVSTGSCTVPYPCPGGGKVVADFGAFGRVELELQA